MPTLRLYFQAAANRGEQTAQRALIEGLQDLLTGANPSLDFVGNRTHNALHAIFINSRFYKKILPNIQNGTKSLDTSSEDPDSSQPHGDNFLLEITAEQDVLDAINALMADCRKNPHLKSKLMQRSGP